MYPEIFHISFLHTYGVLVALAFLTALWMAGRLGKEASGEEEARRCGEEEGNSVGHDFHLCVGLIPDHTGG